LAPEHAGLAAADSLFVERTFASEASRVSVQTASESVLLAFAASSAASRPFAPQRESWAELSVADLQFGVVSEATEVSRFSVDASPHSLLGSGAARSAARLPIEPFAPEGTSLDVASAVLADGSFATDVAGLSVDALSRVGLGTATASDCASGPHGPGGEEWASLGVAGLVFHGFAEATLVTLPSVDAFARPLHVSAAASPRAHAPILPVVPEWTRCLFGAVGKFNGSSQTTEITRLSVQTSSFVFSHSVSASSVAR